jgi:hypothetical protein
MVIAELAVKARAKSGPGLVRQPRHVRLASEMSAP